MHHLGITLEIRSVAHVAIFSWYTQEIDTLSLSTLGTNGCFELYPHNVVLSISKYIMTSNIKLFQWGSTKKIVIKKLKVHVVYTRSEFHETDFNFCFHETDLGVGKFNKKKSSFLNLYFLFISVNN